MWRKPEISSERQVSSRLRGTSSHLLLRTAADNCCRRSHRAKRAPERLAARGQAIARSRGARLPLGELLGELPASSSPVQPSPTQPSPAEPPRGAHLPAAARPAPSPGRGPRQGPASAAVSGCPAPPPCRNSRCLGKWLFYEWEGSAPFCARAASRLYEWVGTGAPVRMLASLL